MKKSGESLVIPQKSAISLEALPPPPQSPLLFFLNLCHLILFVPFRIKWNYSINRFMLQNNTIIQSVFCALVHLLVISYHIFTLTDHFLNFHKLSGSLVSACFDIVNNIASAILWLYFMKFIWFQKEKIQDIINVTISTSLKIFHMKIIKFIVISMGLSYAYFNFDAANLINKRSMETEDLPLYYELFKFFSFCWPPGYWILMLVQTHVLSFYFVNHGLIFVLSCTMLAKAWEFKQQIYSLGTENIDKVKY